MIYGIYGVGAGIAVACGLIVLCIPPAIFGNEYLWITVPLGLAPAIGLWSLASYLYCLDRKQSGRKYGVSSQGVLLITNLAIAIVAVTAILAGVVINNIALEHIAYEKALSALSRAEVAYMQEVKRVMVESNNGSENKLEMLVDEMQRCKSEAQKLNTN